MGNLLRPAEIIFHPKMKDTRSKEINGKGGKECTLPHSLNSMICMKSPNFDTNIIHLFSHLNKQSNFNICLTSFCVIKNESDGLTFVRHQLFFVSDYYKHFRNYSFGFQYSRNEKVLYPPPPCFYVTYNMSHKFDNILCHLWLCSGRTQNLINVMFMHILSNYTSKLNM